MSPRVGTVLRAALLAIGLAVLALVIVASRPADAQTDPPASGTWSVNDTTEWSEPVTLMGDLVVESGGDLRLNDMELVFWCFQKSEFGVKVMGGGRLSAINVVFRSMNSSFPCKFNLMTNSAANLLNCTLQNVGSFGPTKDTWGVFIHSSQVVMSNCTVTRCNVGIMVHGLISPSITGCNISDNNDRGIWCMYSTPYIANNVFRNNSYGIYVEESSDLLMRNNDFVSNRREALAMDANSSVLEWDIDGPTVWSNSTVLLRGNIIVHEGGVLWLNESALIVDSKPGSRKTIHVDPGGVLDLDQSTIGPAPGGGDRNFGFTMEGDLTLDGSAVHGVGYDRTNMALSGIFIATGARINGSDLTGNLVSLACSGQVLATNTSLGGSWLDIWYSGTVRLMNASFEAAKSCSSGQQAMLEVGWHLSAGVVWQNGRGVSGATLTVRDSLQKVLFDGPPGPDGWVRWIETVQYRVGGGQNISLGEIGLVASRTGFSDISRQVEMTADREERLIFTDPAPPSVAILSHENGSGTNLNWVLLSGTASDDLGLDRTEIRLDDSLRWQALPPGDWTFNLTNLSRGDHRVQVRATDLSGQTAYANLTITVDFEPPRLEIDEPFDETVLSAKRNARFAGRTDPDAKLTIDGIPVQVDAAGRFDRSFDLPEGYHEVRIAATDRGGNTVTATRKITVDLTPPLITVLSPANKTRTKLDELSIAGIVEPGARFRVDGSTVILGPDGSFNVTVLLSGGPKNIELYAEDRAGNSNTTIWTLDRRLDPPAAQNTLQKYGLALALGAVLAAVAVAAVTVAVVRRKGRPRKTPPPMVEEPGTPARRL